MCVHPKDIRSLVPIAESVNAHNWQQLHMCVHPKDNLSLVPIAECANAHTWQQHSTCVHPKDIRSLVPIAIFLICLCVQHIYMCVHPMNILSPLRTVVDPNDRQRLLRSKVNPYLWETTRDRNSKSNKTCPYAHV